MNITPFVLNGWPMNEVDQKMMAKLREAADQLDITVDEVIDEAVEMYLDRHACVQDAPIISLPLS
jgi:copper homeostasis protein CutC